MLPELALTGYVSPRGDFDVSRFAEAPDGPLLGRVRALARAHGVAVLASWVERDGAHCFNSATLVGSTGATVLHYRKRHPWIPETWATPGDLGTPIGTVFGLRVAVAVCFDVHFVSAEAGDALDEVDALLFPSAWVDDDRHDLRSALLPALAARHGCAVVNANWGPGAPRVAGQGRSRILDGRGAPIALAPLGGGVRLVSADVVPRTPLPLRARAMKCPGS